MIVMMMMKLLLLIGAALAALVFVKALGLWIVIGEREVGIVVKKFSLRSLSAGRLIATNGEAGLQAATLAPGWHFGYWIWQYRIQKVAVTEIPQGEIGLVVAADGAPIPASRLLGKVVPCDKFQDAKTFLANGGEKGRQLGVLTAGSYRINTAVFTVITRMTANRHGMDPSDLLVYSVEPDMVGIVTTLDGAPIDEGEIAGPVIPGHDNFQDAQAFLKGGGKRGLQEQVLLSGNWNLNPWFARVEAVPMTMIPIGHVGVVISYVGKPHEDVSGVDFKHGDLVKPGVKGVWVVPLYPGKHPINTRVMKVELVPTTNIVLNWANRVEGHKLDEKLGSITVRSKDGFGFSLDVSQVIHVGALDAPKVISRVGSMQNLVDHVLQPLVGNYFRNSAQSYTVLDFLFARSERQTDAADHIRKALLGYDVQAIDTLIGDITPPAELMATQTQRKIAEEERKTFEVQKLAQAERQCLVRETATADIQSDLVRAEQGVSIADLQAQSRVKEAQGDAAIAELRAQSRVKQANGEAEAVRVEGLAQAEAYRAGVAALGTSGYTALQMMQIVGERGVRIIPEIAVNGANGTGGVAEALLATMLRKEVAAEKRPATTTLPAAPATVPAAGNGR